MGPVYAQLSGLNTASVATFMAVSILAAVITQYPVGRLSDRIDRRTGDRRRVHLGRAHCRQPSPRSRRCRTRHFCFSRRCSAASF